MYEYYIEPRSKTMVCSKLSHKILVFFTRDPDCFMHLNLPPPPIILTGCYLMPNGGTDDTTHVHLTIGIILPYKFIFGST